MAVTPIQATLTVTTSGTEVRCTADTAIRPASVYFEAARANSGVVYIGLSDVSTTNYIVSLAAGEGFSLGAAEIGRVGGVGIQLSSMYVDAATNGDKIQMTYMYPTGG